jgi:hypothetical protein
MALVGTVKEIKYLLNWQWQLQKESGKWASINSLSTRIYTYTYIQSKHEKETIFAILTLKNIDFGRIGQKGICQYLFFFYTYWLREKQIIKKKKSTKQASDRENLLSLFTQEKKPGLSLSLST